MKLDDGCSLKESQSSHEGVKIVADRILQIRSKWAMYVKFKIETKTKERSEQVSIFESLNRRLKWLTVEKLVNTDNRIIHNKGWKTAATNEEKTKKYI